MHYTYKTTTKLIKQVMKLSVTITKVFSNMSFGDKMFVITSVSDVDLTHRQGERGEDGEGAALLLGRSGHQRGGLQVVRDCEVHHRIAAAWCVEGRQERKRREGITQMITFAIADTLRSSL